MILWFCVQPFPGKQGCIRNNGELGRWMPSFQACSLHPSPPSFTCWECNMLQVGQAGSDVPAVSPPSSLCIPAPLTGGVGWGEGKALTLWVLFSSNEVISELSKLFSTNPSHRPMSDTVKKINALSAKTSTLSKIARTTKFSYGRSVFLGVQVFSGKFYFVSFFGFSEESLLNILKICNNPQGNGIKYNTEFMNHKKYWLAREKKCLIRLKNVLWNCRDLNF